MTFLKGMNVLAAASAVFGFLLASSGGIITVLNTLPSSYTWVGPVVIALGVLQVMNTHRLEVLDRKTTAGKLNAVIQAIPVANPVTTPPVAGQSVI